LPKPLKIFDPFCRIVTRPPPPRHGIESKVSKLSKTARNPGKKNDSQGTTVKAATESFKHDRNAAKKNVLPKFEQIRLVPRQTFHYGTNRKISSISQEEQP